MQAHIQRRPAVRACAGSAGRGATLALRLRLVKKRARASGNGGDGRRQPSGVAAAERGRSS